MITALNKELLAQDPSKVQAITEALERLAQHEATEADTALFDCFRVVSIGINPDLLVATRVGGGR